MYIDIRRTTVGKWRILLFNLVFNTFPFTSFLFFLQLCYQQILRKSRGFPSWGFRSPTFMRLFCGRKTCGWLNEKPTFLFRTSSIPPLMMHALYIGIWTVNVIYAISYMIYLFKIYDLFIIACFSLPLGACNWSTSPCVFPGRAWPNRVQPMRWSIKWRQRGGTSTTPGTGFITTHIINHLFSRISCTKFQHFTCPKNSRRAKLKKYAKM